MVPNGLGIVRYRQLRGVILAASLGGGGGGGGLGLAILCGLGSGGIGGRLHRDVAGSLGLLNCLDLSSRRRGLDLLVDVAHVEPGKGRR